MTLAIPTTLWVAQQSSLPPENWWLVGLTASLFAIWLAFLTIAWWRSRKQNRALAVDHTRLSRAVHGLCRKAAGATQTWQPDPTIEWTAEQMRAWRKESGSHER